MSKTGMSKMGGDFIDGIVVNRVAVFDHVFNMMGDQ